MTDRYAVFGNPIEHSLSPTIHQLFAQQTQQSITYEKILAPKDGFKAAVAEFIKAGGKGLNITLPFKVEACEIVDKLSDRAKVARAINTIKVDGDELFGDNTDGAGLLGDIKRLNFSPAAKRILILGAGGAVRGVLPLLLSEKPSCIFIANRTIEKAKALASYYEDSQLVSAGGFADLSAQEAFDIVINTTSSSLQKVDLPLPTTIFSDKSLSYDMVYGTQPTTFMVWSEKHNASLVSDGMGMLVGQAAESFYLWRGVRPEINPVLAYLRHGEH